MLFLKLIHEVLLLPRQVTRIWRQPYIAIEGAVEADTRSVVGGEDVLENCLSAVLAELERELVDEEALAELRLSQVVVVVQGDVVDPSHVEVLHGFGGILAVFVGHVAIPASLGNEADIVLVCGQLQRVFIGVSNLNIQIHHILVVVCDSV